LLELDRSITLVSLKRLIVIHLNNVHQGRTLWPAVPGRKISMNTGRSSRNCFGAPRQICAPIGATALQKAVKASGRRSDHHGCQKRGFNLENQGRSITVIFDVRFQISALKIPHRRRRGVVLNIRGKRRSRPLTHLFRILSHQTHEGGEQRPAQDAQRQDGRFAAIGEMNGAITVIFAVLDTEGVSIISARPASITERRLLP
jgi:uncharacterized DUF497 family protein